MTAACISKTEKIQKLLLVLNNFPLETLVVS